MTAGQASTKTGSRVGREKGTGPELYDFRRPTKLSREHVRTLQLVFETFARQYTTLLTSTLRSVAQVSLVSIEQLTYDEYISQLSNPTLMVTLAVDPLPGSGVLEFSIGSAMACVDHMLGGRGAAGQPERPLTEIESSLLRDLLERILHELRYSFETLVTLDPSVLAFEYNPQFAQVASPNDLVLIASFDMKVGDNETVATMCLPFAPMLALLEAHANQHISSARERQARENAAAKLARRMQDVPLEVTVRFDASITHPESLVGLAIGDVVPLSHPTSVPLTVRAADTVFAHATPGSAGKRLAVLVVDPPLPVEGPPRVSSGRPLPTTAALAKEYA